MEKKLWVIKTLGYFSDQLFFYICFIFSKSHKSFNLILQEWNLIHFTVVIYEQNEMYICVCTSCKITSLLLPLLGKGNLLSLPSQQRTHNQMDIFIFLSSVKPFSRSHDLYIQFVYFIGQICHFQFIVWIIEHLKAIIYKYNSVAFCDRLTHW